MNYQITNTKKAFLLLVFLLGCFFTNTLEAQQTFAPRLENESDPTLKYINIRGDYTFLANSVMNRVDDFDNTNNNVPYNGTLGNNQWIREYVDIDGDNTTFSSSSSTLTTPDCSQIYWAGLYWAGNYDVERYTRNSYPYAYDAALYPDDNTHNDVTSIKFRVPGGTYVDITADTAADPVGDEDDIIIDGYADGVADSPYVCYKNVTGMLQALADPDGEYFAANIRGTRGGNTYGVAGWTLVVIYENPTLTGKYISVFDGYEGVTTQSNASSRANIDIAGFNTIPAGPVRARIGVGVLEGETDLTGDRFRIRTPLNNTYSNLSNTANPANNFFNSSITIDGANVATRNINSTNSMGFDSDIFNINNPANSVIDNGETSARLQLRTSADWFGAFLVTFGVDILEPDIVLEKKVEDIAGNDITGLGVNLGQTLEYVLSFQNRGNDDGTAYTIRDVLPINVFPPGGPTSNFDPADITTPAGVTYTYDSSTREIVFSIPDNLIEIGDPVSSIRMRVKVAENCFDFVNACTDLIQNLAYSTYEGVINDNVISDDPSVSDFDDCGFVTPGATNFLLDDLENCNFTRTVQLCGDDVLLDAGDNFDTYVWVIDDNGNGLFDATDTVITDGDPDNDPSTLLVTQEGTYIVDKIVADPCKGFKEIMVVERFGINTVNPIVDYFNTVNADADVTNDIEGEIATCSIDGDLLAKIFLCGAGDSQILQTNITDAQTISWEVLDESSCTAAPDDCANKNATCGWSQVATGSTYTANNAGKYRLVVTYQNGCFNRFYFDVFQNNLNVEYDTRDIICTTDGYINITNPGTGYGFQLVDITNNAILVPYSANNGPNFPITSNGQYRVDVVPLDGTGNPILNSCVFSTPDIGVRDRDFQVDITTTAANCNSQGSIQVDVLNVEPDYTYVLRQSDGTLIDDETAQPDNTHTFNVNQGDYIIEVATADGCTFTQNVNVGRIVDPSVSALLTQNIGCTAGSITLTASDGLPDPNYSFAIWSYNGTDLYPTVGDIPGDQYQVNPAFTFGWRDTDSDGTDEYFPGEDGTYVFIVVDANGCFALSNPVAISDNGIMTASVTDDVLISCTGSNNAAITIVPSGGVAPFTFSIDGGLTIQTTPSFVGLSAGSYSIEINDSSGCTVDLIHNISDPFPLSASAGVSRDATCDPLGGEVRITNVVGGTAPYEYSFDGGATYGASTTAVLPVGTYTLIVRDATGCEFPMTVTVEDTPPPPGVSLTPEVNYNCDGTGTITATPSIATYNYTYELDGVPNAPDPTSNVFLNVGPGTYTVRTNYVNATPPTPSLLLSEDFGNGLTIPNPNTTGYFYENQLDDTSPSGAPIDNGRAINDYEYAVTSNIESPFGAWINPDDHTSNGTVADGRYLVINIGAPAPGQIIYQMPINDIIPNRPLEVSLWLINLIRNSTSLVEPDLTIELRDTSSGAVVATANTGAVPNNELWNEYVLTLDPGANTSLDLVITTNESQINGNDVAIDDITVYQTPEVCPLFVETPVTVVAGLVFGSAGIGSTNVSCNGLTDGTITFEVENFDATAGFDYSVDGGTNWTNSTASLVTTGAIYGAGSHTVLVRKANEITCTTSVTTTITEPDAIVASASITTSLNCTNGGATITASAIGGLPTYEYQLEDNSGGVITAYQPGTTFTGVAPGDYIVRARDNNSCEDPIDTQLTVTPINSIDFDLDATNCYSGANDAFIEVDVTDGNGNYTFSINGGPWVTPTPATDTTYRFENLSNGTYAINVSDGSGCIGAAQNITIDEAITVSASAPPITACGTSTIVTFSASGGDGSFQYAIVPDGTTPSMPDYDASLTREIFAPGDYDVYLRDPSGGPNRCDAFTEITITQDASLTVAVTNTPILCSGSAQANITITPGGGAAPYTYSIDDGATYQTSNTFSNQAAGSYNIRVRDANNCEATDILSISEPFTLSASALVAELIECNPVAGAEVRIVNARGGTTPYEYSFDGGATYQASNISNLFPGDHTVFVRDANNCSLAMDVTVLPEQVPPGVTTNLEYFCDGDATITVTPDDPQYTYTYEIDNVLNTPADSNVFTDVPAGDHIVTVNYVVTTVVPPSTLLTEDFGFGTNTPISEIDPVYCYEPQDGSASLCGFGVDTHIQDGEYSVTQSVDNLYPAWHISPNDHTGNPGGRYLAINVGGVAGIGGVIYAKRNVEVLPNQDITISLWAFNLFSSTVSGGDPSVEIQLVDGGGAIIASTTTGNVPKNTGPDDWHNYSVNLNPGANTTLDIVLRTNSNIIFGNDIVIDDILATQPPAKCPAEVSLDVLVEADRALAGDVTATDNITCNGLSDGNITFEVENFNATTGFEYAVNGGAFSAAQFASPITASGLASGTNTIVVRDVVTNSCSFTITQDLTEPLAITGAANVTSPNTCIAGATVTASATGGTPVYEYQLENTSGGVLTAYQSSPIFNGLADADYVVRIRDANLCETTAPVTVDAPTVPTFTATPTTCYSGANDATIVVDVTSIPGNGGFLFSLNGGPFLAPTPTTDTTYTFDNLSAGTYTIDVRDSFGCAGVQQSVTINPELNVSATAPNITACATTTDVTIVANGGDTNFVYAIVADGATPVAGDFSATTTQTVTGASDYDVYVRDNSGTATFCEASFDLNITQDAPIVITPTVTDVLCNGETTGAISLAVTGGNAPYTYQLEDNTPSILTAYQTGSSFVNLAAANTYVVRVRDANGCDTSLPITIDEPDAIVAEATITQDYTCLVLGQITVGNVTPTTGGSGNYQYRINGGAWTASTALGHVFTDLTDGTYSIEVRDAITTTCITTLADVIVPPLPVEPTLATTIAYNCDGTGSVTITPLDPTYTYNIDGGAFQTSNVFNNIAVGSHTLEVNYGSGCTVDTTLVIEDGNAFEATITDFTNLTCNASADGDITITATNFDAGTGFEYNINGGAFTTSLTSPVTITSLTAQAHSIIIRDLRNTTSCSITLNQTLTEPTPVVADATITAPFTCNNTGATITASATGGTPTYEYQLEDTSAVVITAYQAGDTFANVPAGDYIIRARDTNSCSDPIDTAITIIAPTVPTFTATPTACYSGANDASIVVDVTSVPGNGGFLFSLNGGPFIVPTPTTATTYTFNNLSAGTYTIDVQDAFGCAATQQSVTINPELTAIGVLSPDLTCLTPATVIINTAGGNGTYSYEWSNDAGATYNTTNFVGNVFSTSTPGTYLFRATDTSAASCSVITATVTITPADIPVITAVTPTNILCNGELTGALDVTIDTSIGRPPYTIEVIETITTTNYGTQTTGLPAGTYEVRVTDDKGCVSPPFPATITQPDAIVYDIALIPITCSTTSTTPGSITVENMTGGTAEYTYDLTGNNGFSATYTTTSGGEDHTFAILDFGIYEIVVVDANGCSVRTTNIIASPPDDLDIDVSSPPVDCTTGGTAVVEVSSTAVGSGNYEFAVLETFIPPYASTYNAPDAPGGSIATYTGLTPGVTYTFVVHDITSNCYYFETAATPIISLSNLTTSIDAVANITCTGSADGNVSFTFDNYDAGATDVSYEVFNAQSNVTTGITGSSPVTSGPVTVSNLGPLPQGIYYVLLTEVGGAVSGCSVSTADITITESVNILQIAASSPTNDNCLANAGVISAIAQDGTAPYEFQYLLNTDPAPTATDAGWASNTTANVESGDYIVYVKDANGCIQSDAVTVNLDPSPEISVSIVDECVAEGTFEVLVTLDQAGITPYLLSLNGGAFQNITFNGSNEYTFSNVSSGAAQTIEIRDLNGCGETENFSIVAPLQFTVTQTELLDCEVGVAGYAELTVEVTSGSGNYEVSIDGPGLVDLTATVLAPNPFVWAGASVGGDYAVSVYDLGTAPPNCNETITVNVPNAVLPVFTETHADVTCNGGADGSITLANIDNGINPLVYTLTPMPVGAILNGDTFENLPAGTYDVQARGSNNCLATITNIVIDEPNAIVVAAPTVQDFACTAGNNPNNATITLNTITGGSNSFVRYEFINNQGTVATGDDVVVQDGASTSYIETNILGGDYTINVYDSNGCVGSTIAAIVPFDELLPATTTIDTEISCVNSGEDITINAFGSLTDSSTPLGLANYEFRQLPSGAFQASNQFTNLPAGNYSFEVRNVNTGCLVSITHAVEDPNTFEITTTTTDVVCFGTDGSVSFTINDPVNVYTDGFTWQIYNTLGTAVLTDDVLIVGAAGVSANVGPTAPFAIGQGTYRVDIIQDSDPTCTNTDFFNIAGPPAVIAADTSVTDITCAGNDGIIDVIDVTGGFGGYQYYISTTTNPDANDASNYTTASRAENLAPGTYDIWVIDQNGCAFEMPDVTLADPTPVTASLQVNNPNCDGLEGVIEVTGTAGGQGSNYSYQLQRFDGTSFVDLRAIQTNTVFDNLGEGEYQVVVTDQWTCTVTTNTVLLYEEIVPLATIVKTIDCTVDPGGQITITQTGGSGSFDYEVRYPGTLATDPADDTNTTGVFTTLTLVGDYVFTITDQAAGHACSVAITQGLAPAVFPVLNIDAFTNETCNSADDGTITVSAIDSGTTPYIFEITHVDAVLLGAPIAATTSTDLSATFTGLTGTAAGTVYTITATGVNECATPINQTITQPDVIVVALPTVVNFACTAGNNTDNATITLNAITGGSNTFVRYEFVNNQGTVATGDDVVVQDGANTSYIETNILGGDYTINVYDSNGCIGTTTAAILPFDELLTAVPSITNAISCNPIPDGEITIAVTSTVNDASRFEYSIDNGAMYQVSNVFSGLDVGTHNFLVRHIDTGCIIPATETLENPNTFTIDINKITDVVCFGTATGEITIELVDATYAGDFDWEIFNTNGTPANMADDTSVNSGTEATNGPTASINLPVGSYYVNVSQNNHPSCINTEFFTILGPSTAITGDTEVMPITCAGNDGSIEIIDVLGGWGNYSYLVFETGTLPTPDTNDASNYFSSPLFDTLSPGTYHVWVIDANGCSHQIPDVILADPTPIAATLQLNQPNCPNFSGEIEVISVTGGQGSNYTYQLIKDGTPIGTAQNTPVFSGLDAGNYTVQIGDQWSCTFTTPTAIELYEPIAPLTTVVKTIDCTLDPGGQITITQTGGSGNFNYGVRYPGTLATDPADDTNTTGVFTTLTLVGDYVFTIADQAVGHACPVMITQSLQDRILPVPTIDSFTNVTCNGADDGTITVSTVNNGVQPYTFEIISGPGSSAIFPIVATSNTATSAVFEGLEGNAAGITYTIRARGANNCFVDIPQVITQPDVIANVNATVVEFGCATGNNTDNATITIDAGITGGSGNYVRYEFINTDSGTTVQDGANSSYTETNFLGGNYSINVYDDNGCIGNTAAVIAPFTVISDPTVMVTQDITCDPTILEEIQVGVTITPAAGAVNLEYTATGTNVVYNQTNTTGTFVGMGIGNYAISITNLTTGCVVQTTHEILDPDVIRVIATKLTDEECLNNGVDEGSFEIAINNYTGNYSYQLYDNTDAPVAGAGNSGTGNTATPLIFSNLPGGVYYVRIIETDAPFCQDDSNAITIIAPEFPVSVTTTPQASPSCTDDQGSILVDPEGGVGPYTITLTNTTTAQTYTETNVEAFIFTGLSGGNFDIAVTDAQACPITDTAVLVTPDPLVADIVLTTPLICYNGNIGAVTASENIRNVTPNYLYQLNRYDAAGTTILTTSATQTSNTFSGLNAGFYSITVSDDVGCSDETPLVEIVNPTEVVPQLIRTSPLTCTTGIELLLSATGGSGTYEYSVDNVSWITMTGNSAAIPNASITGPLGAGTYRYYVRDAVNGCTSVLSNEISEDAIMPLAFAEVNATIISCVGDTATIMADATGGLGNYMYELYTDVSLSAASRIAGPQTSGTFNNLTSGTYYVNVISEDCTTPAEQVDIAEPIPLDYTDDFTNALCFGDENGTITVTLSGGAGGYQYAISPNLNQFDTENTFDELAPGDYTVIAQDQNGCFIQLDYTITEPELLTATGVATPEVCAGDQDGTITLTVEGGTAPYSTRLSDEANFVQDRIDFNGLSAGGYIIFVRDANGCMTDVGITIEEGANLNATVEPIYECTGDTPDNYVNITLEDPSVIGDVLYALDSTDPADMQLNPDFRNTAPGSHYIAIAHANGCIRTIDFEIEDFEPLTLTLEQSGINTITATSTGGLEDYTFYFDGVNNGADNTYIISRTDTFVVRVIDANGCEVLANIDMEFIDIEIPNFFTPDGDGLNDVWMPLNQEGFPEILTIIFDRYGRELYRMTLNSPGWDGLYNQSELPTGDYWYVIKLRGENDDREFVGHFTLYR